MSDYPTTPNLGLPLIPDGDKAWGPAMRGAMATLDGAVPTRGERTVHAVTASIGFYETTHLEIDLSLACDLTVLVTDHPAWVRFYGSDAARTEDATRLVSQKVRDGRGCYGDGITYLPDSLLLNWSEVPTFHNLDTPRTGKAYLAVTGMEPGYNGPITLDITYLPIEDLLPGASQGLPGLDGRTILVLDRDPMASDGQDGDVALNKVAWTIFAPKAAGAWPAGMPIIGPAGLPGDPGAPGAPGTNGTNGTNGLDGKNVRYGAADPTGSDGVDGEFWINTTSHYLFGPKAAGAWPAGISLVGPTGGGKTYSLTETATQDVWLGKTVYMKTINFGTLPNATTKSVAHGISGLTRVTDIRGYAYAPSIGLFIGLPWVGSASGWDTEISVDATNISIRSGQNISVYTECYVVLEYVK